VHGYASGFIPRTKDGKSKGRLENFPDDLYPRRYVRLWTPDQSKNLGAVSKESIQSGPWNRVSIKDIFIILRYITDYFFLARKKVFHERYREPGARRDESKSFPANDISRMDKEPKYRPGNRGRVNLNRRIKIARDCLGRMRQKSLLDVTPRRGYGSRVKGLNEVSQRGLILFFWWLAPFGAGVTLVVTDTGTGGERSDGGIVCAVIIGVVSVGGFSALLLLNFLFVLDGLDGSESCCSLWTGIHDVESESDVASGML